MSRKPKNSVSIKPTHLQQSSTDCTLFFAFSMTTLTLETVDYSPSPHIYLWGMCQYSALHPAPAQTQVILSLITQFWQLQESMSKWEHPFCDTLLESVCSFKKMSVLEIHFHFVYLLNFIKCFFFFTLLSASAPLFQCDNTVDLCIYCNWLILSHTANWIILLREHSQKGYWNNPAAVIEGFWWVISIYSDV